ncbi:MAG: sortase [Firmicutes bacterium]|nr:sortase [Bacillota bacterium]
MRAKSVGKLLTAAGLVMVFAAAGIYAVYDRADRDAGDSAQELLDALDAADSGTSADNADSGADADADAYSYVEAVSAAGEMPQKTLKGYALIGEIIIPSVGIDLPVLNDWSYNLLKIAPCRYSGTVEDGNLIILGHNYRSHFTPLKNVAVGDEVRFTDVNGMTYTYRVDEIETLYKTQLDDLTITDYDLTLFTCTTGGQSRFVARCSRTD